MWIKKVFLLCLAITALAQQYLPKQGPLPMTQLFANNIACSGDNDFWRVDTNADYSTLVSAYPVRPNAVTKVSFYLVYGNEMHIGCGKPDFTRLDSQFVGQFPNSIGYHPKNGQKYIRGDPIDYGSPAIAGDTITMTIDLRPFKNTVSFQKDGRDMGRAFGGLNFWGDDIYIMVSLARVGTRIKIIKYTVEQ